MYVTLKLGKQVMKKRGMRKTTRRTVKRIEWWRKMSKVRKERLLMRGTKMMSETKCCSYFFYRF